MVQSGPYETADTGWRRRFRILAGLETTVPEASSGVVRAGSGAAATDSPLDALRSRPLDGRRSVAGSRAAIGSGTITPSRPDATAVDRLVTGWLALAADAEAARGHDEPFVIAAVKAKPAGPSGSRGARTELPPRAITSVLQAGLRPSDVVVHFGLDSFICGLRGVELAESERRFALIRTWLERTLGVSLRVGLAPLAASETLEELTDRAWFTLEMRAGSSMTNETVARG